MGLSKMPRGDWKFCASCKNCLCGDTPADAYSFIDNAGKYKCTYYGNRVYACARPKSARCYDEVASYNLADREEAYGLSKKYGRFYITTAIFKKLGMINSNELDELYSFRNTYLEAYRDNFDYLTDYDIFGPVIAKYIETFDSGLLSRKLYEFYLKGTIDLIHKGAYYSASELYFSMYDRLKQDIIINPMKEKDAKHYI